LDSQLALPIAVRAVNNTAFGIAAQALIYLASSVTGFARDGVWLSKLRVDGAAFVALGMSQS
jgi:hypothetical protein